MTEIDTEINIDELRPVAMTDAPFPLSLTSWTTDLWFRWSQKFAVKRIPLSPYVLQVGLGDDTYLNRNHQASGADTDEALVKKFHDEGYLRIKHANFSEENCVIPFPDEEFETVFVLDVLEYYTRRELEEIFTEFARVMKKGATLLLFVANKKGYDEGVARGLAYETFIDEAEVKNLAASMFWYTNNYSSPLPRDFARLTPCCREVFEMVKL